jgi:hypothetical protein
MRRDRSTASYALVEEKREEMDFFLDRLSGSPDDLFLFRCYFSAFASAAMSVLYALDSTRKRIDPKFDAWYQPRRLKLVKEEAITSYVLERRDEAVHIGETRVNSGRMTRAASGDPTFEHFFSLGIGRKEPVSVDVLTACEITRNAICRLVDEVPEAFPRIRFDYLLDAKVLKGEGLTVEDVEEQLGLPRGWTFVEGCTDQQRLDALRNAV